MISQTSCNLSRSNRTREGVQHLHVQTPFMTVIFKTLGLIRLSRSLSYTNHESGKFQSFHVQSAGQLCRGNFYPDPVLHEKGQPGGAIFIQRQEEMRMSMSHLKQFASRSSSARDLATFKKNLSKLKTSPRRKL